MKIILLIIGLFAVTFAKFQYPVRCIEVGDSVLGTVTDCDVASDPLPFKWSSTIQAKKNVKWAGIDDFYTIYSNPDQTIVANCSNAASLPGNFTKNDNIFLQQTCFGFDPPLEKYATLVVLVFYTHHETFDDVLMYNFPIPGSTI